MGWSIKFFPIYFFRLPPAFCEEWIWWIISNYILEFHLIIHLLIQQMFIVHFLWARVRIEWWVISDTGPSFMEFAVFCNSQDISQKPCCIIVSNTITIIKFIVTSHWEAVCPPGIMSYTISYCCPSFLSWQLPSIHLRAGQLCFAVGKHFRALIKKNFFLIMEKWQFFHEPWFLARFEELNTSNLKHGKKKITCHSSITRSRIADSLQGVPPSVPS